MKRIKVSWPLFSLWLLLSFFCGSGSLWSQSYQLTNSFTTKDGLPSNLIYDSVIDDNGFLWIATDNGISRFDGRRFTNYSTKNGLPSNDIIQVIKQADGTIWANSFKQCPSYFDEKTNRFVCLEYDKRILPICSILLKSNYDVNKNGLYFSNEKGYFKIKNKKIIEAQRNKISEERDCISLFNFSKAVKMKGAQTIIDKNKSKFTYVINFNKKSDTITLISKQWCGMSYGLRNYIFCFYDNYFTKLTFHKLSPLNYSTKNIATPPIKWFKFSGKRLAIICLNGDTYIYDKNSLQLLDSIKCNFNVNSTSFDYQGNAWVATLDKGLHYYTRKKIINEQFGNSEKKSFLSVKISDDNQLFAGNQQGGIYSIANGKTKKHQLKKNNSNDLWVRDIVFFRGKTIAVTDPGLFVNFNKTVNLFTENHSLYNLKACLKFNDNTLIVGCNIGLLSFDVTNEKYTNLHFEEGNIISIVPKDRTSFYFIAGKGLYSYDVSKKSYRLEIPNTRFNQDKIQHIENTPDGHLWISTYRGNLFYVENNVIKKKYISHSQIPVNISKLLNIKNQLWIASKTGVYILDYKIPKHDKISKLTTIDGLSSDYVSFLDYKNDTVYAATDNGISKIPFKDINSNYSINPYVVSIKINGKTVDLKNEFSLKSNQNNISLEVTGVDVTNHFKSLQYSLNNKDFISINGNFLNLQLNYGTSEITLRAIDVNNKVHAKKLKLIFHIDNPFYKTIWFWALLTTSLLVIALLIFYIRKLKIQKRLFDQQLQLEQQRNKITADLHDDIGATLSSLQLNSAVANQLIKKDIEKAKVLIDKIENQSKDLADKIGDIVWSMKPGKDEFMSMSSRIKNYANDIFGATNIYFSVTINPEIDKLITDITIRKNLVLITKEAINNAAKYSRAKNVTISFQKLGNKLTLIISDDGIGFDPRKINGNGITNIKKRVYEINGVLNIISEENKGSTIKVEISYP